MKSCAKEPNLCSTTHLESTEFSAKKGERLHSPQTSLLKGVTRAIKLGEGWRFSEFRRWQMRDNIQRPTPRRIEETHAIYWLRGSPVGRNANPPNSAPEPSTSLILSAVLHVDERAVDEIDLSGQVDQELVEVKERHVAPGAAAQPHGCQLQMFHCFFSRALMRYGSIDRSRFISATVEPWPKIAPVGQACMHLPHDVQVGDFPTADACR